MIVIETSATQPELEMFRLTEVGYAAIGRFFGQKKLVDLGVLEDPLSGLVNSASPSAASDDGRHRHD
jgi:hypothetical protein